MSRQTNLKSSTAMDGASMSTSCENVPKMVVECGSTSGQTEPEQFVGQSGETQGTWVNVKDRDVSNAGPQSSEPEAHGLHRS